MAARSKRIPDFFFLPFGYRVEVEVLSDREFNAEYGENCYAQWDDDDKVISLRASRKKRKRRLDFAHEMQHCIVDWAEWVAS